MLEGATFTRSRRGTVLHRRIVSLLISGMVKSSVKDFVCVLRVSVGAGGDKASSRKRNPLRIAKLIWLRE